MSFHLPKLCQILSKKVFKMFSPTADQNKKKFNFLQSKQTMSVCRVLTKKKCLSAQFSTQNRSAKTPSNNPPKAVNVTVTVPASSRHVQLPAIKYQIINLHLGQRQLSNCRNSSLPSKIIMLAFGKGISSSSCSLISVVTYIYFF